MTVMLSDVLIRSALARDCVYLWCLLADNSTLLQNKVTLLRENPKYPGIFSQIELTMFYAFGIVSAVW